MSTTRRLKHISAAVFLGFSLSLVLPADAGAASRTKTTATRTRSFLYRVRRGETLHSIARKFGITVKALRNANDLDSDKLYAGQRLMIPGRAQLASRSSHKRPTPPVYTTPAPPVPLTTTVVQRSELVIGGEILSPKPMRVRRGPKNFHATLAIVAPGTPLRLLSEDNGWYAVQLPNGEIGYILGDEFNVEVQIPDPSWTPQEVHGSDIVREAMRYLGIRYVWGGESDRGMDCSGFIYMVFQTKLPGLERLRSYDYFQMGAPVDKESLMPGDLVFFTTYARGPSHVGIYVGEGKFIHASSGAGLVTITPLDHLYYAARYLGARRLVKP